MTTEISNNSIGPEISNMATKLITGYFSIKNVSWRLRSIRDKNMAYFAEIVLRSSVSANATEVQKQVQKQTLSLAKSPWAGYYAALNVFALHTVSQKIRL